jgi:hypothetical protein
MNIVLTDCICEQIVSSIDYLTDEELEQYKAKTQSTPHVIHRTVQRHLQQAMVPGNQLKSIQIQKDLYHHIVTDVKDQQQQQNKDNDKGEADKLLVQDT